MKSILLSSVSDPSHFDVDPDPPFLNSGSGCGSSDPHLEKVNPDSVHNTKCDTTYVVCAHSYSRRNNTRAHTQTF